MESTASLITRTTNDITQVQNVYMMLVMNYTSIAIVWFSAIRIQNGHMQVGTLMALI